MKKNCISKTERRTGLDSGYFWCFFNVILTVFWYNGCTSLFLHQILKFTKIGITMFSPDNSYTHAHTHTHTHIRTLTHTSQMTLALVLIFFFNSISKTQHLDIFCLFKCTGSSQVSIYTHTHTHIYTNSMSITMALTWFRVTTGKHLRFLLFFFLLSASVELNLWSFGALQSHHVEDHSNINLYLPTDIYLAIDKKERKKEKLIQ